MRAEDGSGHLGPSFGLSVNDEPGRHVVAVTGEVDMSTAPELSDALTHIAADSDVVVDLSAVSFMDSTGLGALIAASKRVAGLGRRLILRRPSPRVNRLLEVSGLDETFTVEN